MPPQVDCSATCSVRALRCQRRVVTLSVRVSVILAFADILFSQDVREKAKKDGSDVPNVTAISELWKSLPEGEKEVSRHMHREHTHALPERPTRLSCDFCGACVSACRGGPGVCVQYGSVALTAALTCLLPLCWGPAVSTLQVYFKRHAAEKEIRDKKMAAYKAGLSGDHGDSAAGEAHEDEEEHDDAAAQAQVEDEEEEEPEEEVKPKKEHKKKKKHHKKSKHSSEDDE